LLGRPIEFDPTTNTYTNETPTNLGSGIFNSMNNAAYAFNMLMLPTGQVALSDFTDSAFDIYTPDGGPAASWQPAVTNIYSTGGD
jgi:hypothetical protein